MVCCCFGCVSSKPEFLCFLNSQERFPQPIAETVMFFLCDRVTAHFLETDLKRVDVWCASLLPSNVHLAVFFFGLCTFFD